MKEVMKLLITLSAIVAISAVLINDVAKAVSRAAMVVKRKRRRGDIGRTASDTVEGRTVAGLVETLRQAVRDIEEGDKKRKYVWIGIAPPPPTSNDGVN